jgi:hypothetical protein
MKCFCYLYYYWEGGHSEDQDVDGRIILEKI